MRAAKEDAIAKRLQETMSKTANELITHSGRENDIAGARVQSLLEGAHHKSKATHSANAKFQNREVAFLLTDRQGY